MITVVKKEHARDIRQDDWMDPLYLNLLLTEEEKLIKKTANDYCNSKLSFITLGNNFELQ